MSPEPAFDALMERLRRGERQAAEEIFHRFARRLIGLARSRLEPAIRQKVDPEDVMASVFKSFFLRHAGGQFELDDWDGLWSLLTVITLRKCGHKVEHFRAARRDVKREVHAPDTADDSSAWLGGRGTRADALRGGHADGDARGRYCVAWTAATARSSNWACKGTRPPRSAHGSAAPSARSTAC